MKRFISTLLMVIAMLLAGGTIAITAYAMKAEPTMLKYPKAAENQAKAFMDAVTSGNYGMAEMYVYGTPSLGKLPEEVSPAIELLWLSYVSSLDYTLLGKCYINDSGLALDVNVRSLDVSSVTQGLDERARKRLNQRMDAAEDSAEIYDENNEYRQELVANVLRESIRDALAEDAEYREQRVTLHMVYEEDQWWILPEAGILNVLSGAISG